MPNRLSRLSRLSRQQEFDVHSVSQSGISELVLITGMSGSGKSVVVHALEDAGFFCIDNLPPELLLSFVTLDQTQRQRRVAVAMDARSAASLSGLPIVLDEVRSKGVAVRAIFLEASTETLIHRYSESRRRHPLSRFYGEGSEIGPHNLHMALVSAIELERELLAELRELSHIIDTSLMRTAELRDNVKQLLSAPTSELTLVFESFAFKRGIPIDADYVFDVRMLPNPYYEHALRPLNGTDAPVIAFLNAQPESALLLADIREFLEKWLPPLALHHRGYVTVAIGCTGGQHRSVYLVEQLHQHFSTRWVTLRRHREMHRSQ